MTPVKLNELFTVPVHDAPDLPPESVDIARLNAKVASLRARVAELEACVEELAGRVAKFEQDNAPTLPRWEIPEEIPVYYEDTQ